MGILTHEQRDHLHNMLDGSMQGLDRIFTQMADAAKMMSAAGMSSEMLEAMLTARDQVQHIIDNLENRLPHWEGELPESYEIVQIGDGWTNSIGQADLRCDACDESIGDCECVECDSDLDEEIPHVCGQHCTPYLDVEEHESDLDPRDHAGSYVVMRADGRYWRIETIND